MQPASEIAHLLGSGNLPIPGELVLAHRGVLHLDESAFSSELFNALPPVLKTGELALDRRGIVTRFPARIQFVLDDGHWMTGQNLRATGGLV